MSGHSACLGKYRTSNGLLEYKRFTVSAYTELEKLRKMAALRNGLKGRRILDSGEGIPRLIYLSGHPSDFSVPSLPPYFPAFAISLSTVPTPLICIDSRPLSPTLACWKLFILTHPFYWSISLSPRGCLLISFLSSVFPWIVVCTVWRHSFEWQARPPSSCAVFRHLCRLVDVFVSCRYPTAS